VKTKVLIRVDASSSIGLGHLVRCIALAHMIKDDFAIIFYCKDLPYSMVNEIAANGFGLIFIKNETDFFKAIEINLIVILDGYHFGTEYQKGIKFKGSKLVCIDDLHDKEFFADLIINHAPDIKPQDYKAHFYTQFALGLEYALLRPAFLAQAGKIRHLKKIQTVLICFGGSDLNNLTKRALKIVLGFNSFKKILVVTGLLYNYRDTLVSLINGDNRIYHYHDVDESKMALLMSEAELAIVPASGILIETMAMGCVVVSGMSANNQKFIYYQYKAASAFFDALNFKESALKSAIEKAFIFSNAKTKIIDGNSGKRLLKVFNQLEKVNKLNLRKAEDSDVEITYKWASDPTVRVYSFNQHKISFNEHSSWFKMKVADRKCFYFIAELDKKNIGSIRFDMKGDEAIISYLVDPAFHGMGLGKLLLINGISCLNQLIQKNDLCSIRIIGYVMKTNIPSIKAFESLSFTRQDETDKYKYEMVLQ
jgi:UDP-2,4-diacetamido-2,4,6-trideoxy-beta-L-altropyranose hydrolase